MYVSQQELRNMMSLVQYISSQGISQSSRKTILQRVMHCVGADHGASCHWDQARGTDTDTVYENMSDKNIEDYQQYFQYCDPITKQLRRYHRAVSVNEVISRDRLIKSEFYNDFLQADGLCYGINLHVYDGLHHKFDLRLWRSKRKGDFDKKQLMQLDLLLPHFQLMREQTTKPSSMIEWQLTPKEQTVVNYLKSGLNDKSIARAMHLSVTTVRSHIRSVYSKADVHSRTELIAQLNH